MGKYQLALSVRLYWFEQPEQSEYRKEHRRRITHRTGPSVCKLQNQRERHRSSPRYSPTVTLKCEYKLRSQLNSPNKVVSDLFLNAT